LSSCSEDSIWAISSLAVSRSPVRASIDVAPSSIFILSDAISAAAVARETSLSAAISLRFAISFSNSSLCPSLYLFMFSIVSLCTATTSVNSAIISLSAWISSLKIMRIWLIELTRSCIMFSRLWHMRVQFAMSSLAGVVSLGSAATSLVGSAPLSLTDGLSTVMPSTLTSSTTASSAGRVSSTSRCSPSSSPSSSDSNSSLPREGICAISFSICAISSRPSSPLVLGP